MIQEMKQHFIYFVCFLSNMIIIEGARENNFNPGYPIQELMKNSKHNNISYLYWTKDATNSVMISDLHNNVDYLMDNVKHKQLRVLLHNMDPYLTVDMRNSTMKISGFIGEIWKILQRRLLFSSEYELVEFNEGKTILENGGADIMLSPYVMQSIDLDVYDFSMPITTSWYEMYIRSEDDNGSSSSYMVTFSNQLWIAFICTLALFTFFLWGIPHFRIHHGLDKENEPTCSLQKQLDKYYGFNTIHQNCSENSSLVLSCMVVLGSMAQQGVQMYSGACSVRVVLFVILLFSSLMFTSFSALLVSRLAVGKTNQPFNDIESIAGNDHYSLCVRTNSAIFDIFKDENTSNRIKGKWKSVLNQPPCHKFPTTTDHMASNLCKKKMIIVESHNIMSNLMFKDNKCKMIRMNSFRYAKSHVNILLKKNFTYTYLFSNMILKLHTSGLIHSLEQRFLSNRKSYQPTLWNNTVTIGHIKELLFLYSCAIIFSILLVIVEKTVYSRIHRLN